MRRPLFPGSIMPVTVRNKALIDEVHEIKRSGAQAYVGAFLKKPHIQDPYAQQPGDVLLNNNHVEDTTTGTTTASDKQKGELPADALHEVGTFARVHAIAPQDSGVQLLLLGHRRIRLTDVESEDPLKVAIMHLKDEPFDTSDDVLKAITMEMISTLKDLLLMHPLYNEQMRQHVQFGSDFHDVSRVTDLAASLTSGDSAALQAVLEELDVKERANQALFLLKKELELCKLQADIGKRVEEKISADQRRYFLMEQLKSIKKELGLEKDDKTALTQKFKDRLDALGEGGIPPHAAAVVEEELEKLAALEPSSSEFNVTRNYLDWLTSLPWTKMSEEKLDIGAARHILDEDHYGLEDVKKRIMEFIAVGKLRGSTQGKIVCLVGPPGVGKTSIGRSIARAINREYFRFSVGGLHDVAEIKGHRRTYVGAMPGKMIQCLKTTATSNPFVLIDEIDKLGKGWQGDPASALLELLDPEQNSSFLDHYLDVPVDLSKVLFMCTANQLDTIPGPLLDRMEVIEVSGYTAREKMSIARKYLEPQSRKGAGVPRGAVEVKDEALDVLVHEYAREAGVRNLKKQMEKIYRKAAYKLVEEHPDLEIHQAPADDSTKEEEEGTTTTATTGTGTNDDDNNNKERQSESLLQHKVVATSSPTVVDESREATVDTTLITIDSSSLKDYVGEPPFKSDKIYEHGTPPGVVMGLAWTALGGTSLYVEAASIAHYPPPLSSSRDSSSSSNTTGYNGGGGGGLKATGQLGDVMKESSTIAHAVARKVLEDKLPHLSGWFSQHTVHLHCPAGATPKDGPSAGITMVTAMLSLALGKSVPADVAMTGEVTLTGKVLPVGGVKEKTLAAQRAGVRMVLLPLGNKRDWEELEEDVRRGIEAGFVDNYDQVFDVVFK